MDGWNTIVSFWDGLFSGAMAVSFREGNFSFAPAQVVALAVLFWYVARRGDSGTTSDPGPTF